MSGEKKNLTYAEKVRMLMAENYWGSNSLGGKVCSFAVADGPLGLRKAKNMADGGGEGCYPSVAYPSAQVLAQTWNRQLAREMGNWLGYDCIDLGVDVLLGPGVNIKRTPVAGRNFEYFSEDPYVSGPMGGEDVRSMQEMHVAASLKHFYATNLEYCRHYASSEVDEATLREIYLKPFELAVRAKPYMVMSSYNLVNGVRMSENPRLLKVLREEFGFDGVIVTDWEACKDAEASITAGTTMIFPYNAERQRELEEAIAAHSLPEEIVEAAARRILELAETCGRDKPLRRAEKTAAERAETAKTIAEEGIVLLKNNGVLPLGREQKVLMTGAPCKLYYAGEGSSRVVPNEEYEGLDAEYRKLGGKAEYCRSAYFELMTPWMNRLCGADVPVCCERAEEADVTVICVGDEPGVESEFYDREKITLSRVEEQMIADISARSKKTVVVVYAGAPIDMTAWIGKVDAVVWGGFGGQCSAKAVAAVLLGDVNPGGRLAETFPLHLSDVPAEQSCRDSFVIRYSEGLNVGYRYFDTYDKPVLFPFGYGLSYSEFAYSGLSAETAGDEIRIGFSVENVSCRDGKEVAQVYVGCGVEGYPLKELKGFEKIPLRAHEKKHVCIKIAVGDLRHFADGEWRHLTDEYTVYVGKNVRDILLSAKISI